MSDLRGFPAFSSPPHEVPATLRAVPQLQPGFQTPQMMAAGAGAGVGGQPVQGSEGSGAGAVLQVAGGRSVPVPAPVLAGGDVGHAAAAERKPGQPIGAVARWKILYGHLEKLQQGDVFTWEEMGAMLGLDFVSARTTIRSAFMRASRELLEQHKRACAPVHGLGWAVAQPADMLKLLSKRQKKVETVLKGSVELVQAVSLDELDEASRAGFEVVGRALRHQADVARHLDIRQDHLEDRVDQVGEVVAMLSQGQRKLATGQQANETRISAIEQQLSLLMNGAPSPAYRPQVTA